MVWGGAPLYDRGMITELGHFALILAFGVAIVQMVVPLIGAHKRWPGSVSYTHLTLPTIYSV